MFEGAELMAYVTTLFTPIVVTVTPEEGEVTGGTKVTIDANVPATLIYTLDGSEPRFGAVGTKRADVPLELEMRVTTRVRFKAFDSRKGKAFNATKTLERTYTVSRTNPAESFRDTNNFYSRLYRSIVDDNFYLTEGKWLLPIGNRPFTYVFVNRQGYPILLRVLHNGVDIYSTFPVVGVDELKEVPIRPTTGDNTIEIQTSRVGSTALFDIGRFDIDVFA